MTHFVYLLCVHSAVIVDMHSEWLVLLAALPLPSAFIWILLDSIHKLQTKITVRFYAVSSETENIPTCSFLSWTQWTRPSLFSAFTLVRITKRQTNHSSNLSLPMLLDLAQMHIAAAERLSRNTRATYNSTALVDILGGLLQGARACNNVRVENHVCMGPPNCTVIATMIEPFSVSFWSACDWRLSTCLSLPLCLLLSADTRVWQFFKLQCHCMEKDGEIILR